MDLQLMLSAKYNKQHMQQIVLWVGADQTRFDILFDFFINADNIDISNKASWAIFHCVENHKIFIKAYIQHLLKRVKEAPIDGVAIQRNGMKILADINIPQIHEAEVLDLCITFVDDPAKSIASRAFAINILTKIGAKYPELLQEMYEVVQKYHNQGTPAYKSSAKRFFALYKQLSNKK
jgi:hypothetical protein